MVGRGGKLQFEARARRSIFRRHGTGREPCFHHGSFRPNEPKPNVSSGGCSTRTPYFRCSFSPPTVCGLCSVSKKQKPFSVRAEGCTTTTSLTRPRRIIRGIKTYPGVLASASSYYPSLPRGTLQWRVQGFRPRLQLRGSAGLAPASPKHVSNSFITIAINRQECQALLRAIIHHRFCLQLVHSL